MIDDTRAEALLRTFVDEHGRAVERLLASLEQDPGVCEELWSEVFTTAFLKIDQLADRSSDRVRQWLLHTARNLTANSARRAITRRKVRTRVDREPRRTAGSAEDAFLAEGGWIDGANHDAIRAAWLDLSDAHREVLALDAHGHDGPSIAAELGITPQAARSRLMRARQAFLDRYEPEVTSP